MSLEEQIIWEKLTGKYPIYYTDGEVPPVQQTTQTNQVTVEKIEQGVDSQQIEQHFVELDRYLKKMDTNRENYAFRHIYSCRAIIGKFIVFGKRVVRKCLKWYIEPICNQQTEFNNAVTPAIGRLCQLQRASLDRIQYQTEKLKSVENIEIQHTTYITQLQQEQSGMTQQLDTLQQEQSGMTQQLDVLQQEQSGMTQQLDVLQQEQSGMTQQLDTLQQKQSDFSGQISLLEQEKQALQTQIQEVTSLLDEQNQNYATAKSQMEQQQQSMQQQMNEMLQQLCEAREQLQELREQGAFAEVVSNEQVMKKSTAQSGEDMISEYIARVLGKKLEDVTYLDLGANHAKLYSNTYHFYQKGVRGVLVEANPALIGELKFYRSGDVILNRCIASTSGETVDFYVLNGDGLSTPDKEGAEAAIRENPVLKIEQVVPVKTITVDEILDTYFDKTPTIVNLDIEGEEMNILNSIDFNKHRPLIMIIETIPYRKHLVVGLKNQEIVDFMASKNYIEYAFTGINSIFLDKEQIAEVLE